MHQTQTLIRMDIQTDIHKYILATVLQLQVPADTYDILLPRWI